MRVLGPHGECLIKSDHPDTSIQTAHPEGSEGSSRRVSMSGLCQREWVRAVKKLRYYTLNKKMLSFVCVGVVLCANSLFSMNTAGEKKADDESFLAGPVVAKQEKKQKRNLTTMRQDVAEELETLLHASSDLIAELAQSQKEFMEYLRNIAENEPALSRGELEALSVRAKHVTEELNKCKTICRKK